MDFRLFSLVALGLACRSVDGEMSPARLEYRVDETGARSGLVWTVSVDSASSTFRAQCEPTRQTPFSCATYPFSASGTIPTAQLKGLFRLASSGDFRRAKPEYDMSGSVADGPALSLKVVTNGRAQSIRWSAAARNLPPVVWALVDSLRLATGFGR